MGTRWMCGAFAAVSLVALAATTVHTAAPPVPDVQDTYWSMSGTEKGKLSGYGGDFGSTSSALYVGTDGTFLGLDNEGNWSSGTWTPVGSSGKKFLATMDATSVADAEGWIGAWIAEYGLTVEDVGVTSHSNVAKLKYSRTLGEYRITVQTKIRFLAIVDGYARKGSYVSKVTGTQYFPE